MKSLTLCYFMAHADAYDDFVDKTNYDNMTYKARP